jgi:hypothetical protein
MITELRAERRLWRSLRRLSRRPVPRGMPAGSTAVARQQRVAIGMGAGVLALLLLVYFLAFQAAFLAVLLVVAVLLLATSVIVSLGYLWWGAGAGRPVLQLDGDTVRGRIRPAFRVDSAEWWDFSVPVGRISGVRLERLDQPAQRWTIAVDLPLDVRDELLARPECSWYAHRLQSSYGSPAAWQAGRMLRRTGRRERVRDLAAALDAARTAANRPG